MEIPRMPPVAPSVSQDMPASRFIQYFRDKAGAPVGDIGLTMKCVGWYENGDPITHIPDGHTLSPCLRCELVVRHQANIILFSRGDGINRIGPNSSNNGVICGHGLDQAPGTGCVDWNALANQPVKPVFIKNGHDLKCPIKAE